MSQVDRDNRRLERCLTKTKRFMFPIFSMTKASRKYDPCSVSLIDPSGLSHTHLAFRCSSEDEPIGVIVI